MKLQLRLRFLFLVLSIVSTVGVACGGPSQSVEPKFKQFKHQRGLADLVVSEYVHEEEQSCRDSVKSYCFVALIIGCFVVARYLKSFADNPEKILSASLFP